MYVYFQFLFAFLYSVVSLVAPRMEEAILTPLLMIVFKRPSILGEKGHMYVPPKH